MPTRQLALVVTRDLDTRLALYRSLDDQGYAVATCSSGIDALKYVTRCKPEIVVCDGCPLDMGWTALAEGIMYVSPETRLVRVEPAAVPYQVVG